MTHIICHRFWAGRSCISDGYLQSLSLYSASDAKNNQFKPCDEDKGATSQGVYCRFANIAWMKHLDTGWLKEEEVVVEATTRTAPKTTISMKSSVIKDASSPVHSSCHHPFQWMQYKQASAKGMPLCRTVEIEIMPGTPNLILNNRFC